MNLTCPGIKQMSQPAVTDELSAFIGAMDKDDICPAFDAHNQVFGNFQQLRDSLRDSFASRSYSNSEFIGRLEAAK